MFLSKVSIITNEHSVDELIKLNANGVYASHQLLWKLFPEQSERNFLYREEINEAGFPCFYLLSATAPESAHPLFKVQSKAFTPLLKAGSRLAFKLRVNPTVCIKNEQGKSKRHDVLMHAKYQAAKQKNSQVEEIQAMMNEAALQWIADQKRLERWGITLDTLPEIESYRQHKSRKKNHQVQFSSVDFQGVLTVQDPEIFLQQYCKGFGRAKAMGCGLMLIRPI